MKYLLLLICFNANALEYSVEYARNRTSMKWLGASEGEYKFPLNTLGLVVFHESNFGVRAAYGLGGATLPEKGAKHPDLVIDLKYSAEIEFLYRYNIYDTTWVYAGVGHYWQHLPIFTKDLVLVKDDYDNDIGWTVGLDHKMNEHISAQIVFHHYSRVNATSRHNGALGSKHEGLGISFRYTF